MLIAMIGSYWHRQRVLIKGNDKMSKSSRTNTETKTKWQRQRQKTQRKRQSDETYQTALAVSLSGKDHYHQASQGHLVKDKSISYDNDDDDDGDDDGNDDDGDDDDDDDENCDNQFDKKQRQRP